MIFMSSILVYASQPTDSLLIQRVWEYGRKLPVFYSDSTSNSYMRYVIDARRRNPILFLVPSMYVVAKGERRYIGEVYGKLNIDKDGHFKLVVAEGVNEEGPTFTFGDTNMRTRFTCGAREFVNKWSEAGPTHHMAAAVGRHIDTILKVAKIFNVPVDVITR